MRRRKKKFLKRNKTAITFLAVFSLAVFLLAFGLDYYRNSNSSKSEIGNKAKEYEFVQYYVPVVHYTDSIETISIADLKNKFASGGTEELFIGSADSDNIKKLLKLSDFSPKVQVLSDLDIVNKVAEKGNRLAIVPFSQVTFRVKSLKVEGKFLWDKAITNYPLKTKIKTRSEREAKNTFNPAKVTLLTNIGDVILGRHVAYKMRAYNDYNHPWLKMADLVKKGDIAFADLETPLSDRIAPPDEGMAFIAPQKAVSGLKLVGVDIVALANNHSTNFGTNVFSETLDLLKKEKINYVGGGINSAEAYKPLIVEKNGLKFAFLDFNSIVGAIEATENTPGVAKFAIKPWSEVDNQSDIQMIKTNIVAAKKQADIIIVEFHWGVEYKADPIQSQIDVAHAAIDSGADIIIGTHPHVVQALESYKNRPVFYSLGNFIFDQEWSIETKQGIVAETYFYNKKLVSVPIYPYQIEDYNQPHLATPEQEKQIFGRIFTASLSADFKY
jgi:poly-gamma-glutamate synthesis protein (capsule biosynthesis protein)